MSGNNFLNSFIHLHIAFEVVSVGNVALCNLLHNGEIDKFIFASFYHVLHSLHRTR